METAGAHSRRNPASRKTASASRAVTRPFRYSAWRRSASSIHAPSKSPSSAPSKLSISRCASCARSVGGNFSASVSSSSLRTGMTLSFWIALLHPFHRRRSFLGGWLREIAAQRRRNAICAGNSPGSQSHLLRPRTKTPVRCDQQDRRMFRWRGRGLAIPRWLWPCRAVRLVPRGG